MQFWPRFGPSWNLFWEKDFAEGRLWVKKKLSRSFAELKPEHVLTGKSRQLEGIGKEMKKPRKTRMNCDFFFQASRMKVELKVAFLRSLTFFLFQIFLLLATWPKYHLLCLKRRLKELRLKSDFIIIQGGNVSIFAHNITKTYWFYLLLN